jgi:hypothetical protein
MVGLSCATAMGGDSQQPKRPMDEPPPLEIKFKQSCGLPPGRQQVYDPSTGVFHIHFKPRRSYLQHGAFEVTRVGERLPKRVVFRLTGVPSSYGCLGHPLILSVGGKCYALDASCEALYYEQAERFDKTLFRSERKGEVVTIQLTEKGQALLEPGARIAFKIDTGW